MEPFALKVPLAGRPIAFEVFRVLTWGHKRRRKTALAIDQNKKKRAAIGVRVSASSLQASQSASYSLD